MVVGNGNKHFTPPCRVAMLSINHVTSLQIVLCLQSYIKKVPLSHMADSQTAPELNLGVLTLFHLTRVTESQPT